jgi:hypothetical protein
MCLESFSYLTNTADREKEYTAVSDIGLSIKAITYSPGNLFMPTQSSRKG